MTFSYTFWEIVITLVGGILLAALFNREGKAFAAMRSIVFMPKYIAISTSAIVFMWILNDQYGFLNYVLGAFGVGPVAWLNSERTALTSVLILTGWRVVGYGMMIYLSAMKGISKDYYEAAELDGAGALKRFRHITVITSYSIHYTKLYEKYAFQPSMNDMMPTVIMVGLHIGTSILKMTPTRPMPSRRAASRKLSSTDLKVCLRRKIM